ncbi:inorganic phosphate transporter, partial [Lacticaseibacillus rhamnosus]
IRFLMKDKENDLSKDEVGKLNAYKKSLDNSTKFITLWVKIAVAVALGLGTMVGWKRIVVTVGEKIGKTHLTYAQGASAELVAMGTSGAAISATGVCGATASTGADMMSFASIASCSVSELSSRANSIRVRRES